MYKPSQITCQLCSQRKPRTGSMALAEREIFVCEECAEKVRPYANATAKAVVNAVRKSLITGQPLPSVEQMVSQIDRPILAAAS